MVLLLIVINLSFKWNFKKLQDIKTIFKESKVNCAGNK